MIKNMESNGGMTLTEENPSFVYQSSLEIIPAA
jgi:hypothetical protein